MIPQKLFVTFTLNYQANYDEFVNYWKQHYDYGDELYHELMQKPQLTTTDVQLLFEWKNGMKLSGGKQKLVNRITGDLDLINQLKNKIDYNTFDKHFTYIPAIWKIFLRHIIHPTETPIFDQHVYRAYSYLNNQELDELKNHKNKEELYFTYYVPFYMDMLENSECTHKQIDEALWSFGKLLSRYKKMFL